ncbi:MAG TPA: hypothetical protein V6D25_14385 [Leptolyngbyaceae cyanobacterium]
MLVGLSGHIINALYTRRRKRPVSPGLLRQFGLGWLDTLEARLHHSDLETSLQSSDPRLLIQVQARLRFWVL